VSFINKGFRANSRDPLDLKMFETTGWCLEESEDDKYDDLVLAVVRPKRGDPISKDPLSFLKYLSQIQQILNPKEIGIIRRSSSPVNYIE